MKRSQYRLLYESLLDAWNEEIGRLGPKAFTKKTRSDLEAGFKDGLRSGLLAMLKECGQKIEADHEDPNPNDAASARRFAGKE